MLSSCSECSEHWTLSRLSDTNPPDGFAVGARAFCSLKWASCERRLTRLEPAAFRHPAMRGCLNKFTLVLALLLAVCGLEFRCSFVVIPGVAAHIQIVTVRVVVRDTNGSSVEAATVTVRNRLTGYTRSS